MAEEQGTATVESAEDEESEREDEPDEDPAQAQGEQEEDKGDDEDAHDPEAAIHSGEQKASEAAEKIAPGAKESAGKVKGAAEGAKEMVTGPRSTVTKLLLPVAAGAGAAATTYVARCAPSLARQLLPGRGGLADELRDRATGATGWAGETLKGHDRGGSQLGRTRRLPIQRWTDVAVPVET